MDILGNSSGGRGNSSGGRGNIGGRGGNDANSRDSNIIGGRNTSNIGGRGGNGTGRGIGAGVSDSRKSDKDVVACPNGEHCPNKDSGCKNIHVLCRNGVKCPKMSSCFFIHPKMSSPEKKVACAEGVNCPNKDKGCKNIHILCKNGDDCKLPTCFFIHPSITITKKFIFIPCKNGVNCQTNECNFQHDLCKNPVQCDDPLCYFIHDSNRRKFCNLAGKKHSRSEVVKLCPFKNCPYLHFKREVECLKYHCDDVYCTRSHLGSPLEIYLQQRISKKVARVASMVNEARREHQKKINSAKVEMLSKAVIDVTTGLPRRDDPFVLKEKELCLQLTSFDDAVWSVWSKLDPKVLHAKNIMQEVPSIDDSSGSKSTALERLHSIESIDPTDSYHRVIREIYRLKQALPALALRSQIVDNVRRYSSVVIKGATGSGKSTQVTQYVAEMVKFAYLEGRKVICTQPRKLAAEALAARVSEEWDSKNLKDKVGFTVGYRVGGMKKTSKNTIIEYQTEGTMLAALLKINNSTTDGNQLLLQNVAAVILDEAHERTVTLDVIIGILQAGQKDGRWPHLRIIVTSATLDTELFSDYLGKAPLIDIPGRMFPVEIFYRPIMEGKDYVQAAVLQAIEIHSTTPLTSGDILVFLTGEAECLKACELFSQRSKGGQPCKVLPLYGKQTREEQAEALSAPSSKCRKVLFSTDVAETSLTIDGVRHVIDSGMTKESVYDPKRNVTVLETRRISKSSATQRKGRAGRTSTGTCYRLYSKDEEHAMKATQTAEILSKPLGQTILTVRAMRLDPFTFNWIEAPNKEALEAAHNDLLYLNALNSSTNELTDIGLLAATLQIEPALARMLYYGCCSGKGEAAATLAALLTVGSSIFWRPAKSKSDEAQDAMIKDKHKSFQLADHGDAVTLYRLYETFKQVLAEASSALLDIDEASEVDSVNTDALGDKLRIEEQQESLLTLDDVVFDTEFNDDEAIIPVENELEDDDNASLASDSEYSVQSSVSDESVDSIGTINTDFIEDIDATDIESIAKIDDEEREEKKSNKVSRSQAVKGWCSENFINSKMLMLVGSTYRELTRGMKTLVPEVWNMQSTQTQMPDNDDEIRRMVLNGFFLNVACACGEETSLYNILRTERHCRGVIHPSSSLKGNNDTVNLQWICYCGILETSRTFLTLVTPIDATWISEQSTEFYGKIMERKMQRLEAVVVDNVRSRPNIIRKLVGRNREYGLKSLADMVDATEITVENSKNRIVAWCIASSKDEVRKKIEAAVDDTINAVRLELVEEILTPSSRVCLRPGGEVELILFPGEFISVNVSNLPAMSRSELLELASQYGKVRSTNIVARERGKVCGQIMYYSKDDAKVAQQSLDGLTILDNFTLKATAGGISFHVHPNSRLSTKLRIAWSIAPVVLNKDGTASAILKYGSPSKAQNAVMSLKANHFNANLCKSKDVGAIPDPNTDQVYLTGLPLTADEEDIMALIRLRGVAVPQYVKVNRKEKLDNDSSGATLTEAVADIMLLIPHRHLVKSAQSFFQNKNTRAGIELQFHDPDDIDVVLNEWSEQRKRELQERRLPPERCGQKIRLFPEYVMKFTLFDRALDTLKILLAKMLEDCETNYNISHRYQPAMNGKVNLYLSSSNLQHLNDITSRIDSAITCLIYQHSHSFLLFTSHREDIVKDSPSSSYIVCDEKFKSVSIYGAPEVKEECKKNLDKKLMDLVQKQFFWNGWLTYRDRMHIISNRASLITEYRLFDFVYDGLSLRVSGLEEDVLKFVGSNRRYLSDTDTRNNRDNAEDICHMCCFAIDEAFLPSACSHDCCKDCVQGMFYGAEAQTDVKLPLVCTHDIGKVSACNTGLAIDDIRSLTSSNAFNFIKQVSVQSYLLANQDTCRKCFTPTCDNILNLQTIPEKMDRKDESKAGGYVVHCDSCEKDFCIFCSERDGEVVLRHKGCSCDMAGKADNVDLRVHVNKIAELMYTRCPRCKTVFLDFSGCFALQCSNSACGCGFCAKCLKDCGNDAHSHVRQCLGGSYWPPNPKETFDTVHRSRYKALINDYLGRIADNNLRKEVLDTIRPSILHDVGIKDL